MSEVAISSATRPAGRAGVAGAVRRVPRPRRARLGAGCAPTEGIFATEEAFTGPGAAWLVAYEGDAPVGCGGLRVVEPGVAEIKRMFVTAAGARSRARPRRCWPSSSSARPAPAIARVRLLTTEVLGEARALYAAEGYDLVERIASRPDRPVEMWFEKALYS